MTVLFLDFDGVLHPEFCAGSKHFENRPHFEAAMRTAPKIIIVISSTWRAHYELDYLRSKFSKDIAERIVGVTPRFSDLDDSEVPGSLLAYPREAECWYWVRHNRPAHTKWLSIDDRSWLFRPFSQRVFEVDGEVGLTPEVALRLQERLQEMETE